MKNTSNEKCKSSCIGQAAGPELENVLYCCILEERKKGIPIATVQILIKAKLILEYMRF